MPQQADSANPKRIIAIDTLRGFALLGILLMNIMFYAMPEIAYFNPTTLFGSAWYDRIAYALVHVIAENKFMAIFSMLFGASVILITKKMESKDINPARHHYTRNFWLLVIGLIHMNLIWSGDILALYAVSAFVLYPLRKLATRWQFVLGLGIFLSPVLVYWAAGEATAQLDDGSIVGLVEIWQPSQAMVQAKIDSYLGPYQLATTYESTDTQSLAAGIYYIALLYNFFTRALGMMLIGMALFSWGVVTASKSALFYRRMMVIGLSVGPLLSIIGLVLHERNSWDALYSPFAGQIWNHVATPFTAFGYVALVMLWSRTGLWGQLQDGLSNVGKMALTNYIGQSLIATFIFYGWGLGLFGSVNRAAQLLFVAAIWGFQIIFSSWWMTRFRYGPLEWLWRSLTYRRLQPIRLGAALLFSVVFFVSACGEGNQLVDQSNQTQGQAEEEINAEAHQFICENNGLGLSIGDVLQATGEHNTFLSLLSQYDPEGFAILSDPELSDKTVWAPTDAALLEIGDSLSSLSDEEIKALLGYHITPPRRTPEGSYPIITPQFLADGVEIIHQTRTGILTGSDQRVRTRVYDGVYTVEDSPIMPVSWCTQTGSVFSISKVITNASPPSWLDNVIYSFFNLWYVYLSVLGIGVVGVIVFLVRRSKKDTYVTQ